LSICNNEAQVTFKPSNFVLVNTANSHNHLEHHQHLQGEIFYSHKKLQTTHHADSY